MGRFVAWVEPMSEAVPAPEYCCVAEETAIKYIKLAAAKNKHEYSSDEEALQDFMVVFYAYFVDGPPQPLKKS